VTFLENRTGDETLDPIGPMASDWITQGLAHADVAMVVPTMTLLQAMGVETALGGDTPGMTRQQVLAKNSGASIVVAGAYYLVSDSLRFHLNVSDARNGEILFSLAPVSGPREDPMETIAQVRAQVTNAMAAHLNPLQDVDIVGRPDLLHKPPAYDAYRAYIAGILEFGVDDDQALRHFESAIRLDPDFVFPWLWIAAAYINRSEPAKVDSIAQHLDRRREQLAPFERLFLDNLKAGLRGDRKESLRLLRMAGEYVPQDYTINYLIALCELNSNYPRSSLQTLGKIDASIVFYASFGGKLRFWVQYRAYHLLREYEQELTVADHALLYHPDDNRFRESKVRALAAMGKLQDIPTVVDEALEYPDHYFDPGCVMSAAAEELRVHTRVVAAREWANRAIAWYHEQPDPSAYGIWLANAYRLAERWEEARIILEELAAEDPGEVEYLGKLGTLAVRTGDERQARELFDTLHNLDRPYLEGEHTYWCACIAALLGDRERAVALLRQAVSQGLVNPDEAFLEMDLGPLRDYPPFQELIRPKG
jgi:tetratricopeptide (TPR) repeat protein